MPTELMEFSDALVRITERASRSTVAVHGEARGSASGVVWRPGVVVTAEHALPREEEVQVTLPDGRVVPAAVQGRDPASDLAVLKCEGADTPPEFGDSGALKAGSLSLVVGRTRASGPVAALGVVSLVAPDRRTWTGTTLAPYIRLDVGLQPTAVGGLVLDARGKASGVATPKFARFGATAIPLTTVGSVVDALLEKGRVPAGYLGLGLQQIRLPEALRSSLQRNERGAAIVLEVEPDGPGHRAGMVIGDILLSLGGRPVSQLADIQAQLGGASIGKPLAAVLVRGGALSEASITVGERLPGRE